MKLATRFSILAAAFLAAVVVWQGCSSDKKPTSSNDTGGPNDLAGADSSYVMAADGDTLTTATGIVLAIGPGALPLDTMVAVIPVSATDNDGLFLGAARMEPDGLILDSAVLVRIPLPSDWDPEDTPLVYEFKGNNPRRAVPSAAWARVVGTPGAYQAEILTSHFSGVVCARNCHAGTIRHVLKTLSDRGCDADSVLARARSRFPGVNIPDDGCGARNPETVQAFLDTHFEDRGGFNAGQPVPANILAELAAYAQAGRQVVLAFKPGQWGARQGTNNFYPTAEIDYAHTAALEVRNGQVMIRNTLATQDQSLITALGGENTVWYPVAQLNEFRNLPQGVAAELQVCGQPDCLSDPTKNQFGIAPFHPVAGQSYIGRAWSDPWTYIFSEGSWSGIPPRGVPWTAVRIYVERLDGPLADLCPDEKSDSSMTATFNLPGHPGPFVAQWVAAGLGSFNEVPGYPAIQGSTDPLYSPERLFESDWILLFFDKTLPGPGTYAFEQGGVTFGWGALFFTTPLITHEGTEFPVTFAATSGTFTLEEYGTSIGSRLRGTFDAGIEGDRSLTPIDEEDPDFETIIGSVTGTFDGVIMGGSATFTVRAGEFNLPPTPRSGTARRAAPSRSVETIR